MVLVERGIYAPVTQDGHTLQIAHFRPARLDMPWLIKPPGKMWLTGLPNVPAKDRVIDPLGYVNVQRVSLARHVIK